MHIFGQSIFLYKETLHQIGLYLAPCQGHINWLYQNMVCLKWVQSLAVVGVGVGVLVVHMQCVLGDIDYKMRGSLVMRLWVYLGVF